MAKEHIPQELRFWIEARRRFHLTHAHIQMARELGLDPRKFGRMANHRQEPWKMPLADFIASRYLKRFRKEQPDSVQAIEEIVADRNRGKAERRERRRLEAEQAAAAQGQAGPQPAAQPADGRAEGAPPTQPTAGGEPGRQEG